VIDKWTAELKRMEGKKHGTHFQVNIDDPARSKFVRLLENVEWCKILSTQARQSIQRRQKHHTTGKTEWN